jgi:hypothetical protein
MHDNGTVRAVSQVGGMLVYYILHGDNITAFPNGFRMIAGDTYQRNFTWPVPDPDASVILSNATLLSQFALQQRALGFNCLHYDTQPNEGSLFRHLLPSKTFIDTYCPDGLRLELLFPSCWNGSLDSHDHKSHMAYASLIMGDGTCPSGYQMRVPTLFFETIYDTAEFRNQIGQFLLANGDPTGMNAPSLPFLLTHS